jgi:hypothetical protein
MMSTPQGQPQTATSDSDIRLYSHKSTLAIALIMPLAASYMLWRNWKSLREYKKAWIEVWVVLGIVAAIVGTTALEIAITRHIVPANAPAASSPFNFVAIAIYALWIRHAAMQGAYLRQRFPLGYKRRSAIVPAIVVTLFFVVVLFCMFAPLILGPISRAQIESSVATTIGEKWKQNPSTANLAAPSFHIEQLDEHFGSGVLSSRLPDGTSVSFNVTFSVDGGSWKLTSLTPK